LEKREKINKKNREGSLKRLTGGKNFQVRREVRIVKGGPGEGLTGGGGGKGKEISDKKKTCFLQGTHKLLEGVQMNHQKKKNSKGKNALNLRYETTT